MRTAIKSPYFVGFIGLMSIDAIITILGAAYSSSFQELNPILSQFVDNIPTFAAIIIIYKIIAIIAVLGIILIANRLKLKWFEENMPKFTFLSMLAMMAAIVVFNLYILI